ncbi:MAG: hypothetical protein KDD02_19645 [Phaeodactylibacter sp.]|nr:hypothetical protein [Phaeodactylibacter sp.]MCB9304473.1 hypothetical protein [Lewinellaceae bacterium]
MARIPFILLSSLCCLPAVGQEWITVAELTIEVGPGKEETVYYGFEAGDEMLVNLEMVEGKSLRTFEVEEYPDNSRLLEYDVTGIKDKRLKVYSRGIYRFYLRNTALLKKAVYRLHLQRRPASPSTANFNPAVKWVERVDTTYSVQSETLVEGSEVKEVQQRRRVLDKVDTSVVTILEKLERVHSRTNFGSDNVAYVTFELPQNRYEPNKTEPYQVTEVTSWAYWIGTGEAGKQVLDEANVKALAKIAKGVTTGAISAGLVSSGYGALALLAIEGVSTFSNPPSGENVKYEILRDQNGSYELLSKGNSVTGFGRVGHYTQGNFAIKLDNDNYVEGINVNVKVIAVTETRSYRDEYVTEVREVPVSERKVVRTPIFNRVKAPVLSEQ